MIFSRSRKKKKKEKEKEKIKKDKKGKRFLGMYRKKRKKVSADCIKKPILILV